MTEEIYTVTGIKGLKATKIASTVSIALTEDLFAVKRFLIMLGAMKMSRKGAKTGTVLAYLVWRVLDGKFENQEI